MGVEKPDPPKPPLPSQFIALQLTVLPSPNLLTIVSHANFFQVFIYKVEMQNLLEVKVTLFSLFLSTQALQCHLAIQETEGIHMSAPLIHPT